MLIVLLIVAGFSSDFDVGDACIDALDQLRAEEQMEILATDVLEDNVLSFTLGDRSERYSRRWHSRRWQGQKTAILVCERKVEDLVDEVDDPLDDALVEDEG